MKRVNLAITKCTNPKCNFRIIADTIMKTCPVCKSKTVKDKGYQVQGILDTEDSCVILKEKKNDNNQSRNFKK